VYAKLQGLMEVRRSLGDLKIVHLNEEDIT
jgi:hypothetical protein